jgi:hypothetical protein
MAEMRASMRRGPAPLLSRVQPGAGFAWMRMGTEVFRDPSDPGPPNPVLDALTGELLVAGAADPGAIMLLLGTRDASTLEPLIDPLEPLIAQLVATELPALPGVEWSIETTEIGRGGRRARAIHLAMEDSMLAQVLARRTGLHPEAWLFAVDGAMVTAIGPDRAHGSGLLAATITTSADVLIGLPPQLVAALEREEVGFIVHVPLDVLQSAPLLDLVVAALGIPGSPLAPEQLLAITSLAAPFSSATLWATTRGGDPVVHVAVQAIGHRATEEGRAVLDAAHAVIHGGDPIEQFGRLATTYPGSAMASAYAIRASSGSTAPLTKSGVGALLAGAVALVGVLSASAMASELPTDDRFEAYENTGATPPTPAKPRG